MTRKVSGQASSEKAKNNYNNKKEKAGGAMVFCFLLEEGREEREVGRLLTRDWTAAKAFKIFSLLFAPPCILA